MAREPNLPHNLLCFPQLYPALLNLFMCLTIFYIYIKTGL